MPTTREQLRRMVAERKAPPRGFAWGELMEALEQMSDAARNRAVCPLGDEDVGVLVDLLSQRGRIPLRGQPPIPHSMPPEELVQFRALKILEQAGRLDTIRDSLERLNREPGSPALRGLARQLLQRLEDEEEA
ncbi:MULTISPECIES: hypothetical protein [Myxococcus]|uniref:DUSAM domain-containing protein n=1 Tax=Myxococcus landrumensis TaxID=2813577 RepID=A0ABX7NCF7_9BACT|nr:hypothetical protein [Myxococcus landrumus]QSQ16074.1 hypothetical protein JY572_08500 [Myxococcus landrumus]